MAQQSAWIEVSSIPSTWPTQVCALKTYNHRSILTGQLGIVLLTDVILAVLPVPLVWTLQVPTRVKFSLIVILGLGFM